MFSINIYLKLAIIAVSFIGGIALAFAFGFWYAFPFFLIGIGFAVSYVMMGTVQSAAQIMETQDFDAVEKRLGLTLKPEWLYVANRSYYFILKGSVAMGRDDMNTAKEWYKKAKEMKLPTDNEKAMVNLQLVGVYSKAGNWNKVNSLMKEVKTLNVTQPQIAAQVEQITSALKQQRGRNPQMMREARNFRQGGKRRRPKMR